MSRAMRLIALAAAGFLLANSITVAQQKGAKGKQVERGKWLVNLGGCHDCHSPKKIGPHGPVVDETRMLSGAPSHNPLPEIPTGILAPDKWGAVTTNDLTTWVGPWGVSFTANLTPDDETGIGTWTETVFIKALRTGKHMGEGRQILPPMPWENFGKLNDADLKSIFAYLKSIPPIKNTVHEPIPPATGSAE